MKYFKGVKEHFDFFSKYNKTTDINKIMMRLEAEQISRIIELRQLGHM